MIPEKAADLEPMLAEVDRQTTEVRELFAPLDEKAATWRPAESKWSVTGHVAHLCVLNGTYIATMRERIDSARTDDREPAEGPYEHPWMGKWFARSMEPPPKWRMKTMRSMVPDPSLESADVVSRFAELQEALRSLMADARRLDLGKVRFGSPFLALIRLSLGTGFALLLAHNRRHIWLVREVLDREGFPGPSGAGEG